MLPWQQAKYSSGAPDKGTQDKCDALHLSNSNSLVLLLCQNMLSLWGLLTHICGCAGKKVKDCTHRVPPPPRTHAKTRKKKATLLEVASIFIVLPPWSPHPLSKRTWQKFLNVSGREFASHFQNAMAFGHLAPMRSREKWRREGKGLGLNMEGRKECLACNA